MRLAPILVICAAWCCSLENLAYAAHPSESLLPATTKGFVSVPDVDLLRNGWDETEIGGLTADPVMQPFFDDLKKQLASKLSMSGDEFGITWEDLKGVYGGETAVAAIQPKGNSAHHAFLLVCDVTGHATEAQALVAKIDAHLKKQGATLTTQNTAGVKVSVYAIPNKPKKPANRKTALVIAKDHLIVSDNVQETLDLLGRLNAPANQGTLQQVPAFKFTMERVAREVGTAQPQVRWFVEPFGLVDVLRSSNVEERRKGLDYLKILRAQGFDGIQGAGGYVQVNTGEYEFLHHTFVYAPTRSATELVGSQNFKDAARMLDFPNAALETPNWLPRELANAVTYNWKVKEAFEFSSTLVNAIAEDPIFEDVIDSFRDDPEGPQIDLRKDLIAYLGTQVVIATDYHLPITPDCERVMIAVKVTDPEKVAAAINKAMARDPDVRKIPMGDRIIWEILDPTDTSPTVITLKIDGPGFGAFGDNLNVQDDEEKPAFPHSAITVAYGWLIWTSHVDFAQELLAERQPAESLVGSVDYLAINAALDKLGAGTGNLRYFARADEAIRPTYELMRQNKMPQAKTLLGRGLNRLFQNEDDKLLRKQEIDAQKLPDFQIVRRHLGPSGVFMRTEVNGWLAVGCGLAKHAE